MAALFQKLLGRLVQDEKDPKPWLALSLFGKHPTYIEHFLYNPAESPRLAAVWSLLYDQGMKSLVAKWERLAPSERLPECKHIIVWRNAQAVFAGRIWPSADAGGRRGFPLIVCAECRNLPLDWVLRTVLPSLEAVEQGCDAAPSLDAVRGIIDSAQKKLRRLTAAPEAAKADPEPSHKALARLADDPALGPDSQGLLRILYQIDRKHDVISGHRSSQIARTSPADAEHVRVPRVGDLPEDSLRTWLEFLAGLMGQASPAVALLPLDQDWVDLLVGEPAPSSFFCIRTSAARIPLTTSIPYTLGLDFIASCQELIARGRTATGPMPLKTAAAPTIAAAEDKSRPPVPMPEITPQESPASAAPVPLPPLTLPLPQFRPAARAPEQAASVPVRLSDRDPSIPAPAVLKETGAPERPIPELEPAAPAPSSALVAPEVPLGPTPSPATVQLTSSRPEPEPPAPSIPQPMAEPTSPTAVDPVPRFVPVSAIAEAKPRGLSLSEGQTVEPVATALPPAEAGRTFAETPAHGPASSSSAATAECQALAPVPGPAAVGPPPAVTRPTSGPDFRFPPQHPPSFQPRVSAGGRRARSKWLATAVGVAALTVVAMVLAYSFLRPQGSGSKTVPVNQNTGPQNSQNVPAPSAPDPRLNWTGPTRLGELNALLKTLNDQHAAVPGPELEKALATFPDRMAQVAAGTWTVQQQATIENALKELDQDLARSIRLATNQLAEREQYAKWLLAIRDFRLDGLPILNQQWVARRDRLLNDVPDLAARQKAVESLKSLMTRLQATDAKLEMPKSSGKSWEDAIAAAALARRQSALARALELIAEPSGVPAFRSAPEIEKLEAESSRWMAQARELVRACARIAERLDVGYLLPLEQKELLAAWDDAQKLAPFADPKVADAMKPLRQPVEAIRQAQLPIEPFDIKAMDDEVAILGKLEKRIGRLDKADRTTLLEQELAAHKIDRWLSFYKAAKSQESLEAVLERLPVFGLTSDRILNDQADRISVSLRFNILLNTLKRHLAAESVDDTAARQAVSAFLDPARKLDARELGDVAPLLQQLAKLQAGGSETPDPTTAGPNRPDWKADTSGNHIHFTWPVGGDRRHEVEFIRIDPPGDSAKPFYLCATEVPLGLFADVVGAYGQWAALRELQKDDRSRGVHCWNWSPRGRPEGMIPANNWIDERYIGGEYYAAASKTRVDRPGRMHPMQQVSISAAAYMASLLHCRLPTVDEWCLAYKHKTQDPPPPANLRDRTWRIQNEHLMQLGIGRAVPHEGIFQPMKLSEGSSPTSWSKLMKGPWTTTGPEDEYDDGILWFRPADAVHGDCFCDLVGNVSEFVCNDLLVWRELSIQKPDSICTFLRSRFVSSANGSLKVRDLFVIGGSALSIPRWQPEEPQRLGAVDLSQKFADVGFRLAFDAPIPSTKERLKALLLRQEYVYGEKRTDTR
ncbi:MAG: hypothetical protein NTU53_18825 [Planctomycetota bacterium]|nr:hypothetical protein [Planctomycetota bacterium]